jgi:hypothetical protein
MNFYGTHTLVFLVVEIKKMHVQELLIYPIKSCAGVKVQEALVTKYGLALPSNPRIFDRYNFFIEYQLFNYVYVLDDGW